LKQSLDHKKAHILSFDVPEGLLPEHVAMPEKQQAPGLPHPGVRPQADALFNRN
jgi:hypothetical protein